jgi:hypothetical protein
MVGKRGEGRYAIITVAHNFEIKGYKYIGAKFMLHRNGMGDCLAKFHVCDIHKYHKFKDSKTSILEGFDLAIAEIKLEPEKDPKTELTRELQIEILESCICPHDEIDINAQGSILSGNANIS